MKDYGWSQLNSTYFERVCRDTLGQMLAARGFSQAVATEVGGVRFRSEGAFLEVTYIPEKSPNYELNIIIGIGDSPSRATKDVNAVPAWFLLREATDGAVAPWHFSSESRLRALLEFEIGPYLADSAAPLALDLPRLRSTIDRFNASL